VVKLLHIQKVTGVCGSENHLLELLPRLDRSRYKVTFLALIEPERPVNAYLKQLSDAGVDTVSMIIPADFSPGLVLQLWRYILREKFELVHTHLIHADLYGALAARLAGVRLVSSKHGCNDFRRGLIGLLDRLAAGKAEKIIAISQAVNKYYQIVEKIPAAKMEVIHYGLDLSKIELHNREEIKQSLNVVPESRVLVSVGRLIPFKAHTCLLEAVAQLLGANYDVELWLIGDGPLKARLQDKSRVLKIDHKVRFFGFRADVTRLLYGADVFVFPSVGEGFGLVLLEAMACGLPIVASYAQSIPEIVLDRKTGLLVRPKDSNALASAIAKLLDDHEFARRMGIAGRQRVAEAFPIQNMIWRTEALYGQLFANGGKNSAG
jgi:glycosyltransferase involved in cell wall biosynthesis